jgi:hypothetical protein
MPASRLLPRIFALLLLPLVASCASVSFPAAGPGQPPFGPQDPNGTRGTMGVGQTFRVRYVADCTKCTITYTAGDGQMEHVDERSGVWQRTVEVAVRTGSAVLTATPVGRNGRVSALRIYVDNVFRARSEPGVGNQTVSIAAPLVGGADSPRTQVPQKLTWVLSRSVRGRTRSSG